MLFTEWSSNPWLSFETYRPEGQAQAKTTPRYSIEEKEAEYDVTLDIPGVPQEALKVELKDGVLNVSAEVSTAGRERRYEVAFSVPKDVDVAKLEAKYEHGVLDLVLPKMERALPRSIPINAPKALA